MFKLFSSNHAASNSTDCSTNSSLNETLPGGPSPDTAIPLHDQAVSRPYHAPAELAGTESRVPLRQPTRNLNITDTRASHPHGFPLCEARPESNPAVAGTDGGAREGSLREKTGRSEPTSVESRHPSRSVPINVVGGDGAFTNGATAAVNGAPEPDVDPSFQSRAVSADEELGQRDKAAISKEEHNVGRKLSKIIKREAKTEKAALQVALKELEEIQKLQKASIKEEAASHSRHSRAVDNVHKTEIELLVARTANDRGKASLRAAEEVLEASSRHRRETTEMLREKMEEVERLRIHKQVSDRERAIKVKSLAGEERTRLSRILRSG